MIHKSGGGYRSLHQVHSTKNAPKSASKKQPDEIDDDEEGDEEIAAYHQAMRETGNLLAMLGSEYGDDAERLVQEHQLKVAGSLNSMVTRAARRATRLIERARSEASRKIRLHVPQFSRLILELRRKINSENLRKGIQPALVNVRA